MKLYFAGRSSSWKEVRTWIERAKQCGHEVTYDWTKDVEKYGRGDQEETPHQVLAQAASSDLTGAYDCDVLVLFLEPNIYGAMVELGAALAGGKNVWLVFFNDEVKYRFSVFFVHPLTEFIVEQELADRLAVDLKYG